MCAQFHNTGINNNSIEDCFGVLFISVFEQNSTQIKYSKQQ